MDQKTHTKQQLWKRITEVSLYVKELSESIETLVATMEARPTIDIAWIACFDKKCELQQKIRDTRDELVHLFDAWDNANNIVSQKDRREMVVSGMYSPERVIN